MKSTTYEAPGLPEMEALYAMEGELAVLAAHVNAATARWLDLIGEFRRRGGADWSDFACWLAFRFGITVREARELVRVLDALVELPLTKAAFQRGELTMTKVRALTRVATPASEGGLLELAGVLTASQLQRAVRAYQRIASRQAGRSHELEYVDYYWDDDGSLVLRARLAAEDGTLLVRALDDARDRVRERKRAAEWQSALDRCEPERSSSVEALLELAATAATAGDDDDGRERPRLVVHVDAAALTTDGPGRCELDSGPVIAAETARRLGCDSDQVTTIERDGMPLSVGRRRRTVPPTIRRLLEARDDGSCRWPGCDRSRRLAAHHKHHWAHGGETSLDNLILLCHHHHRMVHEGGYTIEDTTGGIRFRNRHGILCPTISRPPPPGDADALISQNERRDLRFDRYTNRFGTGDTFNLGHTVLALQHVID